MNESVAARMSLEDPGTRLERKNRFNGNLRFGNAVFHAKTNRTGAGRPSSGSMIREQAKVVVNTGAEKFLRIEEFFYSIDGCTVCG